MEDKPESMKGGSVNEDTSKLGTPQTKRKGGKGKPDGGREKEKHVQTKKVGKAKDELEFATNWRRVFIQIYQHLKWLNAYAQINYVAIQKILKKFCKEYLVLKDNVLDKKLMAYVDSKSFAHRMRIAHVIRDLRLFFALHFTDNSVRQAKAILESHNTQMRRSDAILISFFGSSTLTLFLFSLLFLFMPSSDGDYDYG
mmetsp:Transcript_13148/g.22248  ORF Transcript_13148/g.22248 Transcript_13148/m.22248 type:complete len:198 (-) Transcript_13148:1183-1776(-)